MYDYSTTTNYETMGIFSGIFAIMEVIYIIFLVIAIISIISQWIIYKKAGKGGWEAIIPIYNIIVLLEIVELPIWYIVLFIIPIANIYVFFKIYIELAHKFGKSTKFGVASIFFPFICLPILAFSKNSTYNGRNITPNETQNNPQPELQNNTLQDNVISQNINNDQQPVMFTPVNNTQINPIGINQGPQTIGNNNSQNMQFNINPNVNNNPQPVPFTQQFSEPQSINQTNINSNVVSTPNIVSNPNNIQQIQQPTIMENNPNQPTNIAPEIQNTQIINSYQGNNQGMNTIQNMSTIPTPIDNNMINNQIQSNNIIQSNQVPASNIQNPNNIQNM